MTHAIDYHIIDRCNLNCASCNHFCPLVPSTDKGKSIEQITADLTLLSKVQKEFHMLNLLGGEPTLHPQLSQILRIARQILPNNRINLITNGTKYKEFARWKDALVENKIFVYITEYPYCEDYKERIKIIENTLQPEVEYEVKDFPIDDGFCYEFLSNRDDVATDEEMRMCERPYHCCQLKNGKLYLCNFAAQFDYLKNYFGDEIKIEMDGKEYLDLNGEITPQDYYDFLFCSRPTICHHCLDVHNNWGLGPKHEWSVSKKNINEWMGK